MTYSTERTFSPNPPQRWGSQAYALAKQMSRYNDEYKLTGRVKMPKITPLNRPALPDRLKSDSELDTPTTDDDSDAPLPPEFRKQEQQKKKEEKKVSTTKPKSVAKRKRSSSSDDGYDQFKHLFEDREEYRACMNKTEKEKEQIIYEKLEWFEAKSAREKIEASLAAREAMEEKGKWTDSEDEREHKQKLAASKKGRGRPKKPPAKRPAKMNDDLTDSDLDAEFHQPTEIQRKKKQKSAMATLTQKRKEKEKKEEKKRKETALTLDDVFGKKQDEMSSSSSSSSDSSSSDSSSDDEDMAQIPAVQYKAVETMEELTKARCSRFFLTNIVHTPFFNDVVIGAYCTVRNGPSSQGTGEFRIVKVVDVVYQKVYTLERTKTNKALKTIWGNVERVYPLTVVSNGPFRPQEFVEWREQTETYDQLPTMDLIDEKEKLIAKHRDIEYTPEVVDYMVKEKNKYAPTHMNYAMNKAALIAKRQFAENNGNQEEAAALTKQIEALEQRASEMEKRRLGDIAHVNWINERNRNQQREKFLSGIIKAAPEDKDDPFTRKKERMRVVCGGVKNGEGKVEKDTTENKAEVKEEPMVQSVEESQQSNPSASNPLLPGPSTAPQKDNKPKKINANDIFSLHSAVDLNIDLGILPDIPISTPTTVRESPSAIPTSNSKKAIW